MKKVHDHERINTIKKYNKMSNNDLILELTYYIPSQNDFGVIQSIIQTRLNKKLNNNINSIKTSTDNLKKIIKESNTKTEKYNKIMLGLTGVILLFTFFAGIDFFTTINQNNKNYQRTMIKFNICYDDCLSLVLDENEHQECNNICVEKYGITINEYQKWFIKENK